MNHNQYASKAYSQVSLESSVMGASPHQLITMLFEGAHASLLRAKIAAETGNVALRGKELSRAINIIGNGLQSVLDHERGGAVSAELDRLYSYMIQSLLKANLDNDIALIVHIDRVLLNITDAWKQIG